MSYWLLPPGVEHILRRVIQKRKSPFREADEQPSDLVVEISDPARKTILARNEIWRNYHVNDRRCFIIASGPSIKSQDLTLLKDEFCISVSNSYVHKDYGLIQPSYHCVPFIGGHSQVESGEVICWLQQMEQETGQTIMFFSYNDRELVESNGLFKNRSLYYLDHSLFNSADVERLGIDLTRPVLSPNSVSVMALTIAVFMGFKEIYLLGCDHDWILNWGEDVHFYSKSEHVVLAREGYSEYLKTDDYEKAFRTYLSLWEQYKAVNHFALSNGIRICNATAGGLLDVFPRVEYKSLFGIS